MENSVVVRSRNEGRQGMAGGWGKEVVEWAKGIFLKITEFQKLDYMNEKVVHYILIQ
jgi:hypothetical protein